MQGESARATHISNETISTCQVIPLVVAEDIVASNITDTFKLVAGEKVYDFA